MINDAYSIIESAKLFLNAYIYGPLIEYMYQILIAIGVAVLIKILKYSREYHTARKARKNFFFLDGKKHFLYWNTLKHGKRGHGTICFTSNILGGFDVKIYEELFKMECSYSAKISIDTRILYVDMKREGFGRYLQGYYTNIGDEKICVGLEFATDLEANLGATPLIVSEKELKEDEIRRIIGQANKVISLKTFKILQSARNLYKENSNLT